MSEINATPEEEVAVEHLLRNIADASQGTMSVQVSDKIVGLKVLEQRLTTIRQYLEDVVAGKYTYNTKIINNMQDIFNLLPNLKLEEIVRSFTIKSNDYMYVMYISGLIRSILSLHDLINNKISNKEIELSREKKAKEEEAKKKQEELEAKKKKEEEEAKAVEGAKKD